METHGWPYEDPSGYRFQILIHKTLDLNRIREVEESLLRGAVAMSLLVRKLPGNAQFIIRLR